ncbi:hypothetical protein BASA81_007757 [Batrachochytrium salamandrivorans]|nr:hypothetical protein BASA81_007757 [Batrachochytrium salamandrivorans]
MSIRFALLVNRQGQTRVAQYFGEWVSVAERITLESEIIRKCLSRTELQCSFMTYRNYRVVYRRYASLYFIVGLDAGQQQDINELATLEFIHAFVETLDSYFGNVCELDIMFNIDIAHHVLDEMVVNGHIVETNKTNILKPITLMEKPMA